MIKTDKENALSFLEEKLPRAIRSRYLISNVILALSCLLLGIAKWPLGSWEWKYYDFLYATRLTFNEPAVSGALVHLHLDKESFSDASNSTKSLYLGILEAIRLCDEMGARTVGIDIVLASQNRALNEDFRKAIEKLSLRWGFAVALADYLAYDPVDRRLSLHRSLPTEPSNAHAGLTNIEPEKDGVYRRYAYATRFENELRSSLALVCFALHQNFRIEHQENKATLLQLSGDFSSLEVRQKLGSGLMPIRFAPGIASLSFADLSAARETHPRLLDGKLVLISLRDDGADLGPTPLGPSRALVELHLNALNDLLLGHRLNLGSASSNFIAVGLIALSFFGAARMAEDRKTLFVIWILTVAVSLSAIFWAGNLYLQNAFLLLLSFCLLLGEFARRFLQESFTRRHLDGTLGAYFSPRVYEDILLKPGALEPKEAELTVLVTDLRNFTRICEMIDSKTVFKNVSDLFKIQSDAALANLGNLENLVGDQFLAYWGEPHPVDNPADRAYATLNEILARISEHEADWNNAFESLFGIGFALHCGTGLVGNKGTADRMNYGILGDLVNSSARLESLTKTYGVDVIVTKDFIQKMKSPPECRLVDKVILRGKNRETEIFEPKTIRNADGFEERTKLYESAYQHFRSGLIEKARKALEAPALSGDGPSAILKEKLKKSPS